MLQIIGTKTCRNTQKALRFFKERNVPYHFRDLAEKALSEGELKNIAAACGGVENLLDRESKTWQEKGFAYMDFDPSEEILSDNGILKTPVLRNEGKAVCGSEESVWKQWIKK